MSSRGNIGSALRTCARTRRSPAPLLKASRERLECIPRLSHVRFSAWGQGVARGAPDDWVHRAATGLPAQCLRRFAWSKENQFGMSGPSRLLAAEGDAPCWLQLGARIFPRGSSSAGSVRGAFPASPTMTETVARFVLDHLVLPVTRVGADHPKTRGYCKRS